MKWLARVGVPILFSAVLLVTGGAKAHAALSLTSGNNATTTPSVATSITGFQIVGPAASTTPVKLYTTSGTLSMTTTTGLTFNGASSGSVVYFSGTVADINNALATLKYTRASTGTDTLEVSLVNQGEVFFTDNGHLYKFISNTLDWNGAKTAAEAQTAYGVSGYLATVGSAAENAFISARLTSNGWFGASDAATEGVWKWVTGPEAGTTFWNGAVSGSVVAGQYANWSSGEPNDFSTGEDCAEFISGTGNWNDLPCSGTTRVGYVAEFGTPGNLPTVVARNISIVTADVPAVTSLSPTNASTTVSTSANLVIGFSKSVNKNTGTITIRKSSDDSIAESIDVSGSQVTGGGTSSITIDPSVTLAEGTQYYVLVPGTAFKDGSNNAFDGISATTTWTFTTGDFTPPVISNITATSTASTTATISWDTDEIASSRVTLGPTSSFGSTTSERDTVSRVTSHSLSLASLLPCTKYMYAVNSRDAYANSATSTANTFTTIGCTASSTPTLATSTAISAAAGGTTSLTSSNATIQVTAPSNFTATTSSVVIQVQAIPDTEVISTVGKPSNSLSKVGTIVFDVKAIIDSSTVLDSFNAPVTISYTYTDADIAGLDESTLRLYHYHTSAWEALSDCTVSQSTNTITCSTPNFSIFSLFGDPLAGVQRHAGGGTTFGCKDPKALNYNPFSWSTPSMCRYATVAQATSVVPTTVAPICAQKTYPTKAIRLNVKNDAAQVTLLQKYLNAYEGETLPVTGVYSAVDEAAVIRWQEKYAKDILTPQGLKKGTGYVYTLSLQKFKKLFEAQCAATTSSVVSGSVSLAHATLSRNLMIGMQGSDVLLLQQKLIALVSGPAAAALKDAGTSTYFGARTKAAVIEYQRAKGISPASGVVGPLTMNALQSEGR